MKPSRHSPRSARASSTSGSRGRASPRTPGLLGLTEIRSLAARHGIRPSKSLGQNFLVDPNLARAIAADAGAAPGASIVEVGAGLGALTVALARAGAEVLAIEFDRALVPALREVLEGESRGGGRAGAARRGAMGARGGAPGGARAPAPPLRVNWPAVLGSRRWTMAANLPYNVAVPILLRMLEEAPQVSSYVVMVQREVADRLAARPGAPAYGAVSAKVAYRADVARVRRVPRDVFWPRPRVESTVLQITPRPPSVSIDPHALFTVIDASFGQRRKTMRNAVRRLGLDAAAAAAALREAGVDPSARAEQLALEDLGRLTEVLARAGVVVSS
jgi:16S rRNA (adenine1518-N6/adenine1519-N6)-dimethyltransferase